MDCKFEVKGDKIYVTTEEYWYIIDTLTHSCTAISVDEVLKEQQLRNAEDE